MQTIHFYNLELNACCDFPILLRKTWINLQFLICSESVSVDIDVGQNKKYVSKQQYGGSEYTSGENIKALITLCAHTYCEGVFDDFISSLIFFPLWHSAPSNGLWNFKRHLNNGWITHQDLTHSLTINYKKKKWKQANTDLLQWSMTKLSFCN